MLAQGMFNSIHKTNTVPSHVSTVIINPHIKRTLVKFDQEVLSEVSNAWTASRATRDLHCGRLDRSEFCNSADKAGLTPIGLN